MNTKPTCEAIRDRLTLYLLGDLDPQTQETMARHLAECDACRAYADKLTPTLNGLRDALQEVPEAPLALSDEHRKRIKAAYRQRMTAKKPVKKRKPLLMRFHILEMAAVFIGALMIFSVVVGNFGTHRSVHPAMVRVVEPEPMEELEEIEVPRGKSDTRRYGGAAAREDARPPNDGTAVDFLIAGEPDVSRESNEQGALKNVPGPAPSATPEPPARGWRWKDERRGETVPSSRVMEGERPREPTLSPHKREGETPVEPVPVDDYEVANASGVINDKLIAESVPAGGFAEKKDVDETVVYYRYLPAFKEPPAPTEVQMDISAEMPSLPTADSESARVTTVNVNGHYTVPAPAKSPPPAAPKPLLRFAQRPAPDLLEKLNVPVDSFEAVAPAPPTQTASVQPAEFDSVAIVKSPVVMGGMLGSRSPGRKGEELAAKGFTSDDDIAIAFVDQTGDTGTRQRMSAQAALGPAGKDEANKEVPILGDIPVIGRLIATDRALFAGDLNGREGRPLEEKKRMNDADGDGRDFITITGVGKACSASVISGFAEMGVTKEEKGVPESGQRAESKPGSAGAPPAYKHDELKRNVESAKDEKLLNGWFSQSEVVSEVSALDKLEDEELPDAFAPRFKAAGVNPLVAAVAQPFSTFSIDVDTASYTVSRNYMLGGNLPPPEAVRTEEFVNFFDYAYDPPAGKTFRVASEIAPSRFGRGLHLLKLGVKGRRLGREEQRQASLTLLIDSSGSMNQPDRLGLVRSALELLLDELADTDQVAIIQFDNRARLVLAHTPVAQREKIRHALGAIQCGGGTNLEAGLQQAYAQAAKAFVSRGENRILLLSDGVVNLGETAADAIVKRIESSRQQGLYLSVFGFGMGIYDDAMLKELASKGNGAYAFIDSEAEARRVFVDDLSATLNTIAEDVKIQIEFNPKRVNQYRQLGYEQRQLTKEQFRDDTVDAGEVGSGQSVTALYELSLADLAVAYPAQAQQMPAREANDDWLAVARVRYRRVDNGRIEEIEQRIYERDIQRAFDAASPRFRLAAGVAAFAEILRGSPFVQGVAFDDVAAVLRPVALELHLDARIRELVQMVETAGGLAR